MFLFIQPKPDIGIKQIMYLSTGHVSIDKQDWSSQLSFQLPARLLLVV